MDLNARKLAQSVFMGRADLIELAAALKPSAVILPPTTRTVHTCCRPLHWEQHHACPHGTARLKRRRPPAVLLGRPGAGHASILARPVCSAPAAHQPRQRPTAHNFTRAAPPPLPLTHAETTNNACSYGTADGYTAGGHLVRSEPQNVT